MSQLNPIQLSLDTDLAPHVEVLPHDELPDGSRWLNNAAVGPLIHRIAASRGGGKYLTRCGLIARVCAARAQPVRCPDCWFS